MTSTKHLSLSGELTIYGALELKLQLQQALAGCRCLTLCLREVTELDSAGLQLLLAILREAQSQGKSVVLRNISEAAQACLELFGLTSRFQIADPHRSGGHASDG